MALLRLLAAKRRDPAKGLILIAHEPAALRPFLDAPADQWERAGADWPGPVTWLLPAAPETPWWLTGDHDTLAVRVTAHPTAAALCRAFGGPLVSTSANLFGHPAPRYSWQARAQLGLDVGLVLSGGLTTPGRPSTIRDGTTGDVIRA
jgi:L-threonylcarbamoyladenylate synthase